MKIYFILLLNLLLQYQFLTIDNYVNSKKCIEMNPSSKEDCHKIKSDMSKENNNQEIACCYTTYSSEDEGEVKKCVPIFKTLNGLHMYEEQIKNVGGSGISMDCFSQRTFISLLMIYILLFLLM